MTWTRPLLWMAAGGAAAIVIGSLALWYFIGGFDPVAPCAGHYFC